MKLHKNLEQRTENWYKIRQGSIGGTRAKKVVSSTNTSLMYELIAERGRTSLKIHLFRKRCKGGSILNQSQSLNLAISWNLMFNISEW